MELIVQKFGGTSVADTNRIKKVAQLIQTALTEGNQLIVVVSAMAGVTNQLITLCSEVSALDTSANWAEYDTALCSGEMVTTALLALCLQTVGVKSRSVLAWQLPILTNDNYGHAAVELIDNNILKQCLRRGVVPVVAGFQGITSEHKCTTLGRGGSDTTASLIAASMQANRCDIYTDVEGVFTADPRIVSTAKKLKEISFEDMLELSSSGAKVLHPRCVETAMRYNIPIRVVSSFANNASGTLVTARDKIMEHKAITGITSNKNLLKLTIYSPKVDFGIICSELAQNNIHIELMINMTVGENYSFIVQLSDKNKLELLLHKLNIDFAVDVNIATVSIVGFGIKNDNLFIQAMLEAISKESIAIFAVQISEIKMLLLIEDTHTEKVIRICHRFIDE